ncbi:hypothetical protein H9X81_05805 [Hydrogenoanaerobacterium saccharovorans]|uniref:Uncharacterized protein n=1 Tax=Hydrogenoanaerobacterium saccharovorans TaxID=474960 RepID=A0ABS2GNR0_9FIRM|nr:hypothetical protein [Hydrogenoanaerobacterium saccharovorans]MBM6923204.1 hypothetical protein [Hydrogenoanaerobacterium saccharovorans]
MDDQKERLEQEEAAVKEQTASELAEQTAQVPAAASKRTTRRRRKPAAEKTEPAEQTQLTMDQTAPAEDAGKTAEETAEQPAPKRTACRRKTGTGSTASRTRKKQSEETPAEATAPAEQPAEKTPAEAAAPAEQPAEETPAEAAASAEQPAEEPPAEAAASAEQPAEEVPAEAAAPAEQPAEEVPAEAAAPAEQPAEEVPAEAAPAEQPAEEVPAEAAAPAEKAEEPAQKKPRKKRGKHRYAAPVGGAYILLALIGVIAVIYGAVQLYGKLTDNSKLLRQIERQIQPVMMFDPVPFDNIQDVDNKVLVKTSIWSCMYSDKRGSYTYDDNGMILIPVSDVEVAAVKLYGPEVKLTHTSLDEDGISYTYDAENNVYRVPMMAQGGYYTPMVVDMQKNGDVYEVTVGYVAPGASWTTTEDGDSYTPTPDKYMIYRMKKEDGEYYIVGIKDPGEAPVDTTTPPDVVPGLSSSEAA